MDDHVHKGCSCVSATASVHQTLDEMEWERGIWYAALTGDIDKIRSLIAKSNDPSSVVKAPDNSGYTALHYAARNGHYDVCKLLLSTGAHVDALTRSGHATPLHKAAVTGRLDVLKLLLENKACPTIQDSDGKTILHKAIENKQQAVVEFLLDKYPSLNDFKDHRQRSAMDL